MVTLSPTSYEGRSMYGNGVVNNTVDTVVLAGFPVAVIAGWLPPIAAFVSILYGCVKLYETKTVQSILNKLKGIR